MNSPMSYGEKKKRNLNHDFLRDIGLDETRHGVNGNETIHLAVLLGVKLTQPQPETETKTGTQDTRTISGFQIEAIAM